jgi:hypothetical protein
MLDLQATFVSTRKEFGVAELMYDIVIESEIDKKQ